jgi:T5SS/PEP-CTERM-associated repeat protein
LEKPARQALILFAAYPERGSRVKVVQSNSLLRECVSSAVARVAILTAVVVLSPAAFAQFTGPNQTNTISGVVNDYEDDYYFDQPFCQLQVINGGVLSNFYGYMGYVFSATNNSAVVSGSGSLWYNDGYLYVGYNGAGNQLVISNGGVVYSSPNGYVGYNPASQSNTVLVTGTGSVWSNLTGLYVGNIGAGNQLVISNGGAVYSSSGFIGYSSVSNNVSVTGSGSIWGNSGSLCVGYNSSSVSNKLTVSGGALYVTNGSSNAVLDVRRGTLTLNSGTVTVDRLTLTNGASSVITFSGGVLMTRSTTVSNGAPFTVGDGTSAAKLNLAGGTHSFFNGLAITNNAVLAGTGTINSNVTLAGILSPGSSPGTITNSGNLILQPGAVLNFGLGTNSDLVVVNGNLTLGGTLNVSDSGGFASTTYTLFRYYGTLTTNGSSSILTIGTTPNTNGNYTVDISSNGYVNLIVTGVVPSCTNPVAGFAASSSTSGPVPLAVSFVDNTTGTVISNFWSFGDVGTATFTTQTNVTHTYNTPGSYTATLFATGCTAGSTSTGVVVNAYDPYAWWALNYFGCTNCSQALPGSDPLGKGISNTNQWLLGLNPTNSASVFRIISITAQGNGLWITWTMGSGKTNALQVTSGEANGSYSTNSFTDLFTVTNTAGTVTNYLDVGALTNAPSRFYRVRLVP